MSAFLSALARGVDRTAHASWLPGSMTLVVLALALVLVVHREVVRGALTPEREQRVKATAVVVVPLVLCALLAAGARLIDLVT